MTAQKDGRAKSREAVKGRGSTPKGPATPPRRRGRGIRDAVVHRGPIVPEELALLSEEPLFLDGLKGIAQVHLGGMPDHIIKLAASLGADLAIAYDSLGKRSGKRTGQPRKR
jgi:hypothetical protein